MNTLVISIRFIITLTVLTGVIYPLAVTVTAQTLFPHHAHGSLIRNGGDVIGSELIAQAFSNPKYFWPRPSAVKYDSGSSGATNQSPTSADFVKAVKEREAQGLVGDLRFSSASGLDPDISPGSAEVQLERVAATRKLTPDQREQLKTILAQSITQRQLGVLGEPRVNVLRLNRRVDQAFGENE